MQDTVFVQAKAQGEYTKNQKKISPPKRGCWKKIMVTSLMLEMLIYEFRVAAKVMVTLNTYWLFSFYPPDLKNKTTYRFA